MKPITALIILDGFGCSSDRDCNAIAADGAAHLAALYRQYPHTCLGASGLDVGLPAGQMGNSEVGHLNIGAGRIVYQELTRISKAIDDGDFFENPALLAAVRNAREQGTALHLIGLCSDGGVHSHLSHLYALVRMARDGGLDRVFIHCLMDGRDVPPSSGKGYIAELETELSALGCGKAATVMGRYWAMDRDNRYERVERAYAALSYGEGIPASSASAAMQSAYDRGETDEFVQPTVIQENGKPVATIGPNDSVIFFNFRPDRARELTRSFIFEDFDGFPRRNGFYPLCYVSMTQYDKAFEGRLLVAFSPDGLCDTFGAYLAQCGKTQLRIAETEKYAHVTFFFNGGVEAPNPGEERILIPSPKVATYDLQPEMSAYGVAEEAVRQIRSGRFDVMILNFANPDMVGHTGVMEAAVKAVHAVDECVGTVVDAILAGGGRCIITADHGNCEKMWDETVNAPFTAHTSNPVPCILVDNARQNARLRADGRLSDLAPTLLELLELPKPAAMSGRSLIEG